MDWKQLGKSIAKVGAPLLGTVVGGPVGGTIGAAVASLFGADPGDPAAVDAAIKADPQAALKLREFQLANQTRLQELAVDMARIESQERLTTIQEVNATMRAESKSERWPQYTWRPFNGFCFPIATIAVYFVLPLAGCQVPDVPSGVWGGWLAILGVATWDRGKEKRAKAGEIVKPGVIANTIAAIRGKG